MPVSTTQRTEGSSETWRTTSTRISLVAMSRLFMASGRLRVMVATPSETSSRTGPEVSWPVVSLGVWLVMGASLPHVAGPLCSRSPSVWGIMVIHAWSGLPEARVRCP